MNKLTRLAIVIGSSFAATFSAYANLYTIGQAVSVQEVGVSPTQVVTIQSTVGDTIGTWNVYAGVTQLKVDGVATNSFCIDPYQWSSSSAVPYVVKDLASAPVTEFSATVTPAMGAVAAQTVGKLWAKYYQSALGDAGVAAGLQIAIWETVAGDNFAVTGDLYGYQEMIADVTTGADARIAPANLVAVSSTTNQDYVVLNVPDGGMTVALLGFGMVALAIVRRRTQPVVVTTK
jgi:hypothetical protein